MSTQDFLDVGFRPSDFLRTRRPERYSDSVYLDEPQLSKDLLEYHLETLTSRNQERQFEHFARRLAERELCPNLLPQTGPTGGGDSKVDSETYPVAGEIAAPWYQGSASATERWAFAFSAKRKWRDKVKSDVKGIAGTGRDYSLIYFMTNQFVRDKDRAKLEDELENQYGIKVRILDRQWISTAVLERGSIDLAVELLSIEGLQALRRRRIGPRDAQREVELAALDTQIATTERYAGTHYQLAEDCLSGAVLASELERDRHEVDGRFAAALRVAKSVGDQRQLLRVVYRHAWVSLFVYDDIPETSRLYEEVERLALASEFAEDIELLHNLWNALFGSIAFQEDENAVEQLAKRGKVLEERLIELSSNDARPNNSLYARTILCLHKLTLSRLSDDKKPNIDGACNELTAIFNESRHLGQYPFDAFKDVVLELGNFFAESEAYDDLFETVLAIVEKRKSEGDAGEALVSRGIQQVRQGRTYDAIRLFGRAQSKLIKDEYRSGLTRCLVALGGAYSSASLYWAARSALLASLSICISNFNGTGYMPGLALLATKELAWLELRMGRVPNFLFSLILLNFVAHHIDKDDLDQDAYLDSLQHLDAVFSMLLLRLDVDQLEGLGKLPHLLSELNLICSEGTVIFALGHLDQLRKEAWFEDAADNEEIERFFNRLYRQPANEELPDRPILYDTEMSTLQSRVLGLSLNFLVDSNQVSILISESLLGALEAFLSTSLRGGIMPFKQNPLVEIKAGLEVAGKDEFGLRLIDDSDDADLVVQHTNDFSLTSSAAILKFRETTTEFIARLLPKIAIYRDDEQHLRRLAEEEDVFDRSTLFSDVLTLSENVFGSLEWLKMEKLLKDVSEIGLPLLRRERWKPQPEEETEGREEFRRGEGDPPEEIRDSERLRHSERQVLSLIDVPLWNAAQWHGAFFMIYPEGQFPPAVGLLFRSEREARRIFEGWIQRLGRKDERDELRIAFITGIDSAEPTHYRMHIGSNIRAYRRQSDKGEIVIAARTLTMTPNDDKNLSLFLETYNKYGVYALIPAILERGKTQPVPVKDLFLLKRNLVVMPAWKIGANDEDCIALRSDDNPIIPKDVQNPPVENALARLRERRV